MKVNISWSVNVDGLWWDVQSEHSIADGLSSNDKMAKIRSVISWLASAKGVIPRTTKITKYDNDVAQTEQIDPGPASADATNVWPSPRCPVHNDYMSESKTQKEEGHTMFYCPQRQADGYCKHRAKVALKSGAPHFWAVK